MDYCTFWPDRLFGLDWSHCCAAHDAAYMAGDQKIIADIELIRCVSDAGSPLMAFIMGAGVMTFGVFFYRRRR